MDVNSPEAAIWSENMRLKSENEYLRKGIQDFLNGDWGFRYKNKHEKCPHGCFSWDDCGACADEYFAALLKPSQGNGQ